MKFIQPVYLAGLCIVTALPAVLIVQPAVTDVETVPPVGEHWACA
ncbi:hypothetical protein [Cupriavidus plantarum]|nr:hypothetical protein [Cupriavidus plantarum]NYI02168.1 hypothetical protein [Cupriavidus plantarum]